MPVERTPKSLDPRTLAKLQNLHLRARHIVEGYVAGLHRSPFHGFSIEFAEHREYTAGDDLRYVDWKAFGRTDKLYLKQFDDETNLICYLVLDASESMQYRGPDSPLSKFEYAQCLAIAMSWVVLQQQDAVGLVTFDDQIRTHIRPSTNPSHMQQLLTVLEHTQPHSKTATGPIFHELAQRMKKRGVVVIMSDLFDDVDSLLTGLKHFRYRRHDVVLFHVLDHAELEFPFSRTSLFRGLEGLPDVVADPASLRKAYLQEFSEFLKKIQLGCRNQGLEYVQMKTQRPLDLALSEYLALRMARVK
jgi:uncharacterized protein (DUF58 family)